jgi:hypothetical protein
LSIVIYSNTVIDRWRTVIKGLFLSFLVTYIYRSLGVKCNIFERKGTYIKKYIYIFVYICFVVCLPIIRGRGLESHWLVLCVSQILTWISYVKCRSFFCVQWFEVRGGCSFCWYWWNCWPSLFKLSFPSINLTSKYL